MFQRMMRAKPFFMIEGNIGAGKSTFLRLVQERLPVHIVREPLYRWQQVGETENPLELFYRDPIRWSLVFEMYASMTRVREQHEQEQVNNDAVLVIERSIFSDRYGFAKNMYEHGFMTATEWQIYHEWFSWLLHHVVGKPSGFIYLSARPDTCLERINRRNRKEDATVAMEYLHQLHEKHEDWLVHKKGVDDAIVDVPVLVIDCNKDFEHNKDIQDQHIRAVEQFMAKHVLRERNSSPVTSLAL